MDKRLKEYLKEFEEKFLDLNESTEFNIPNISNKKELGMMLYSYLDTMQPATHEKYLEALGLDGLDYSLHKQGDYDKFNEHMLVNFSEPFQKIMKELDFDWMSDTGRLALRSIAGQVDIHKMAEISGVSLDSVSELSFSDKEHKYTDNQSRVQLKGNEAYVNHTADYLVKESDMIDIDKIIDENKYRYGFGVSLNNKPSEEDVKRYNEITPDAVILEDSDGVSVIAFKCTGADYLQAATILIEQDGGIPTDILTRIDGLKSNASLEAVEIYNQHISDMNRDFNDSHQKEVVETSVSPSLK